MHLCNKQVKINKMKHLFLFIAAAVLMAGCASHHGLTANLNNNTTQVTLSQANYTVTKRVQGQATATYVLGIGGLNREALVAEARANMLENANLIGTSGAVIAETVEIKNTNLIVVRKRTVTVSAHVVEFK